MRIFYIINVELETFYTILQYVFLNFCSPFTLVLFIVLIVYFKFSIVKFIFSSSSAEVKLGIWLQFFYLIFQRFKMSKFKGNDYLLTKIDGK